MLIKEASDFNAKIKFCKEGGWSIFYTHTYGTIYGRQGDTFIKLIFYLFIDTRFWWLCCWFAELLMRCLRVRHCHLEILQERNSFYSESNTACCVLLISTMLGILSKMQFKLRATPILILYVLPFFGIYCEIKYAIHFWNFYCKKKKLSK